MGGAGIDSLGNLVEFGVGLAGFSAIVTVFIHRSRELPPIDRWRILNLLTLALTPPFVALLCIGLMRSLGSEADASRASSALLAVWLVALAIWVARAKGSLPVSHAEAIHPTYLRVMFSLTWGNALAQAVAAMWPPTDGFTVLYFGLVVILLQAVIQFIRTFVGDRVTDPVG